jgi:Uma2 family endonuclease
MATISRSAGRKVDYPTGDGKPMAETDVHRKLMMDLIETLEARYATDPDVYVSGKLLLFYEEGNKRRHLSPDVFVVRGVVKQERENYLTWEEGKGPDLVIELTSKSTRSEDVKKKMKLYRDVLQVPEYFLFDPLEQYLTPPMQGYRLDDGRYEFIGTIAGRLPSQTLGLHLERVGTQLRLYDPATGERLLTKNEQVEQERERAQQEHDRAQQEHERADRAEAEAAQLRRELEALRLERNGGAGR